MKGSTHLGSLAVVAAAILWSLDGLLRRQLFDLPPAVVVLWEHIIGFIVLLPIVSVSWQRFRELKKKQWGTIALVALLSGALGTVMYTAALSKVQFIPFSVVVLLQQLQPVFAIAAAGILLREKLTKRFIVLALAALIAAYGVSFPELRVNLETGVGTALAALLAVGAAAAWGASTAFSKYSLKGTSPLHVTAARFALAPAFAFLLILVTGDISQIGTVSSGQWVYIIAITFSTGMLALLLYYYGLKRILASRSTILELTWPLSSVTFGMLFLGERLSWTQGVSAIALIAIVVTISRMSSDQPA